MIPILALYAVLAMTFTVGKMLLAYLPPLLLNGIRMVLAGLLILGMQYWQSGTLKIKRKDINLFLIVSIIHIFIAYTAEFIALEHIAPSCVALMFNLTPCFTAIFSYFFFGEVMTVKKFIGFAIGLIGIGFMMPSFDSVFCCVAFNWYYLALLTSVISCSLGWVLFRILLAREYSSLHINGFAMLVGGIMSLIAATFESHSVNIGQLPVNFWLLLGTIIVLANIIFYPIYGFLLRRYTATLLSFIGFLTPLFTALYDWLLLGIQAEPTFYIAIVIVGYGIYIFYQEELRQGYAL